MKKLIILVIMLSSCASVKNYDYKPQGMKPVKYQKAHKQRNDFIKIAVVSFFLGYFIADNINLDDKCTK